MTVTKIVANLASADVQGMVDFYADLLSLNILMDQGWITTLGGGELGPVQLSIASQGGSNTPVPGLINAIGVGGANSAAVAISTDLTATTADMTVRQGDDYTGDYKIQVDITSANDLSSDKILFCIKNSAAEHAWRFDVEGSAGEHYFWFDQAR